MFWIIMGVSGTGKSTLGQQLAEALGLTYYEGDDYHPETNVQKMRSGQALTDEDRAGWLATLREVIRTHRDGVMACSALKKRYRDVLDGGGKTRYVHLFGERELLLSRMAGREGHFMPVELLDSQFAALEVPEGVLSFDVALPCEVVLAGVLAGYKRGDL